MKDWLKRLSSGDMTAFDEIYVDTKKCVYYSIYLIIKDEMASEDLMQEVFLDFLDNYQTLSSDIEVAPFLTTCAKNKAINYYNRHKKETEFMIIQQTYDVSEDRYMDTGLLKTIKETLNDKEFEVFTLRVLGEYTFQEISKMKKVPTGTLTWIYQEARKKLEKVFKED